MGPRNRADFSAAHDRDGRVLRQSGTAEHDAEVISAAHGYAAQGYQDVTRLQPAPGGGGRAANRNNRESVHPTAVPKSNPMHPLRADAESAEHNPVSPRARVRNTQQGVGAFVDPWSRGVGGEGAREEAHDENQ
ncbi:MAG: hypothetical protein V3T86_10770 [Planctomycetota bacterium]